MSELSGPLDGTEAPEKQMRLRYAGTCRLCGAGLPAHTDAIYERATKAVRCVQCPTTPSEPADTDVGVLEPIPERVTATPAGTAGASARCEYLRRKANDEQRLRQKWGRLGGIAVALSDERQSTTAWERGAVGEERLGARLDSLTSDDIAVLHDRRIPGTRANIDHIAITRSGIWVIDAKRYKGRPQLKIEGGILRPCVEKVLVGRRDCTKLLDGVLHQMDLVRDVVGDIRVTGALCFVDADWPLVGGSFTARGVHVLWPKRLAKRLLAAPPGPIDVATAATQIAGRFPPA